MRAEQFYGVENIEELAEGLGDGKKTSQADVLIKLALDSDAELYHTPIDDSLVSLDANVNRETWPVRSKATKKWLMRGFYLATGKAPNSEAMQSALR